METLMAKESTSFIGKCVNVASDIINLSAKQLWIDYDREADVLYMSFRKPQRASETIELDNDMLLRKDGTEIVGLTILNASARRTENPNKCEQPRGQNPHAQNAIPTI